MTAAGTAVSDILSTQGLLSVTFDAHQKLIRVAGRGFCDKQTSHEIVANLISAISAQRQRGPVRVLVDGRAMVTQSADVVDWMQVETGRLYREGDRVAVLVSSPLFKLQLQRSVADNFRRLFVSEEEAQAWLAAA